MPEWKSELPTSLVMPLTYPAPHFVKYLNTHTWCRMYALYLKHMWCNTCYMPYVFELVIYGHYNTYPSNTAFHVVVIGCAYMLLVYAQALVYAQVCTCARDNTCTGAHTHTYTPVLPRMCSCMPRPPVTLPAQVRK